MEVASLFGFIIACAVGALIGSISYRTYRPRILQELISSSSRRFSGLQKPSESEKHRLLFELFRRVDQIPKAELSPAAAYIIKKARRGGTAEIYLKAEKIYAELEERMQDSGAADIKLNGNGLYRTSLRLALLGLAEEEVSQLRRELHSWGFGELAPIAGADLDPQSKGREASGIAVPIGIR